MNRLGLTNKKVLVILIALFLLAFLCTLNKRFFTHFFQLPTILYCILFMVWGLMVKRRIINVRIQKRLLMACCFMVLLMGLRASRFNFFDDVSFMSEHLWYAYYIPMTAIPLLGFMAAHNTEPVRNIHRVRIAERILLVCEFVIVIVVLTNHLHNQVFIIQDMDNEKYTRNWFYYIIFGWMVILMVGAFVVLIRKCTFSSVRKKWYIPTLCLLAGYALLVWYLIAGGSPIINGVKVFHLQEAFCFPVITAFESAIQIGLIPANTGYELLFDYSGINAAICDADGRAILTSKNWTPDAGDADHQIRKENISGGYVTWVENMAAINRLNEELAEVTEELEEENDLIRQENEVRAERVSFETKNRLYNTIANAVRPQALKVNELLSENGGNEISRESMIFAAFLSAFIKRMGNLMLISDDNKNVSSSELCMAIRESMDYMELKGISCEIMEDGENELPASFVIYAYDIFEHLMEDEFNSLHSCMVMFEETEDFGITIAFDSPECSMDSDWWKKELAECGSRLKVRNEDDTFYVTILCERTKDQQSDIISLENSGEVGA